MSAKLPIFNNPEDLAQMNTKWASVLNPFLGNPFLQGNILKSVSLFSGVNVLNHLLGRVQQGWVVSDINQPVSIYRSQPLNATTLTLVASGACTVNLYVY